MVHHSRESGNSSNIQASKVTAVSSLSERNARPGAMLSTFCIPAGLSGTCSAARGCIVDGLFPPSVFLRSKCDIPLRGFATVTAGPPFLRDVLSSALASSAKQPRLANLSAWRSARAAARPKQTNGMPIPPASGRGDKSSRWRWHLDEVFVKTNGERHYLSRAINHEGEELESVVTKIRDKKAASKFLRKPCAGTVDRRP